MTESTGTKGGLARPMVTKKGVKTIAQRLVVCGVDHRVTNGGEKKKLLAHCSSPLGCQRPCWALAPRPWALLQVLSVRVPTFYLPPAGPTLPQSEHGPAPPAPRLHPSSRTQSVSAVSFAALHPPRLSTAALPSPTRPVASLRHRHLARLCAGIPPFCPFQGLARSHTRIGHAAERIQCCSHTLLDYPHCWHDDVGRGTSQSDTAESVERRVDYSPTDRLA
eukprot:860456-Rhodomonas_salina.1